ncbi:hypothetical protein [Lysinibacillus pakistanensis]|uniref:Uncharacterized protein n=1 Tax=Lysinibacillus pakistanensis TaxID=759811 RepID=A0AAX3X4Q7_9BACI|nr:hypothetical protein [Lysinibacillus pakistanensis]MDM5233552.1 hypothetical protein [Lysinibacillus pakistanensis]WHY49021.1 hypothetical protein QNH22_12595 [Lysinibacillus pakistanensis]WHY54033.1 hypothetical protein QNH24_12575 [Lysinibacillus pakistanensis]
MKLLDNNFFIFILAFVVAIAFVNQPVVIDFKGIIYFSTYMVILILAGFVTIKFLFKIYDIAILKLSKN